MDDFLPLFLKLPPKTRIQGVSCYCLLSPVLSQGEGNGTPLQYSCLENSMDGGAW